MPSYSLHGFPGPNFPWSYAWWRLHPPQSHVSELSWSAVSLSQPASLHLMRALGTWGDISLSLLSLYLAFTHYCHISLKAPWERICGCVWTCFETHLDFFTSSALWRVSERLYFYSSLHDMFLLLRIGMMVSINALHQELIWDGKIFPAIYSMTLLHNVKGLRCNSSIEAYERLHTLHSLTIYPWCKTINSCSSQVNANASSPLSWLGLEETLPSDHQSHTMCQKLYWSSLINTSYLA